MLALLLSYRSLIFCPTKAALRQILALPKTGVESTPVMIGRARLDRMVREAEVAGYMARATWRVPHKGRSRAYSFVAGLPADVTAFAARKMAGNVD